MKKWVLAQSQKRKKFHLTEAGKLKKKIFKK